MTLDYYREESKDFKKVLDSEDDSDHSADDLAGYFVPELLAFLSKQGNIDDQLDICNNNNIFPTYLTDHLSEEDLKEMKERHNN